MQIVSQTEAVDCIHIKGLLTYSILRFRQLRGGGGVGGGLFGSDPENKVMVIGSI